MYAELLSALQPAACSGLYAHVLCKKATAHRAAYELEAALQCCSWALDMEAGSLECLHLRALVRISVAQRHKHAAYMYHQLYTCCDGCICSLLWNKAAYQRHQMLECASKFLQLAHTAEWWNIIWSQLQGSKLFSWCSRSTCCMSDLTAFEV